MATFRVDIQKHHKKADGTYNIKIRGTHNGKKKYIPTLFFADKEYLTKSLKLKNQAYIDQLAEKCKEYRKKSAE